MITFVAIFIILHGLVHLWYVVISTQLIEFKSEMGWSGESWLLKNMLGEGRTRSLASILYGLAALGFIAAGAGMLAELNWFRPLMLGSAVVSLVAIATFWDGRVSKIIEKGILGLGISLLVIVTTLVFNWPPDFP